MNIIITGAGKGIGYEIAKQFATKENHRVIAISRHCDKLKELNNQKLSSTLVPLKMDIKDLLTDAKSMNEIASLVTKVDILINNAGQLINKPFASTPVEDARGLFDVNFFAPAQLISSLLPLLRLSQNAHVINISSIGGFQGSKKFPGLSYYSASKSALACLTECLAEEYKKENISFNCLALGAVQTKMLEEAFPGYKTPLTAADAAEFIVDFSLKGNKYFNGKVIPFAKNTP